MPSFRLSRCPSDLCFHWSPPNVVPPGDQIIPTVQNVQAVQPLRSVQSPTSFLPRVAGEDEGGGLIDLNGLNDLNLQREQTRHVGL
jgi:hypothetical protein